MVAGNGVPVGFAQHAGMLKMLFTEHSNSEHLYTYQRQKKSTLK